MPLTTALSSPNSAPSAGPPGDDPAIVDGVVPGDEPRSPRALSWVASTYFAEGLPFSIVHQVSMELFTAIGASAEAVGLTALYGLPWNLKFLWAPVVDRYGTLRRWKSVV